MLKLPVVTTTVPGLSAAAASSTSSLMTPSTALVTSPSWSFRKTSPFRFCLRATSRTTNGDSTGTPSARSRTKTLVHPGAVASSVAWAEIESMDEAR